MKCRAITFAPPLGTARILAAPRGGTEREDYYPARRTIPKRGELHLRAVATRSSTNIVNNLRFVNHISLRISLYSGGEHKRGGIAADRLRTVSAAAGTVIDLALKDELDRELALMRRGENIGGNRRRRAMLARYLEGKPVRETLSFYTARMLAAPSASAASEANTADGFQNDIIHERRTETTHVSHEHHTTKIIRREGASEGMRTENAKEIAEQVYSRLERKLRIDRERSGLL